MADELTGGGDVGSGAPSGDGGGGIPDGGGSLRDDVARAFEQSESTDQGKPPAAPARPQTSQAPPAARGERDAAGRFVTGARRPTGAPAAPIGTTPPGQRQPGAEAPAAPVQLKAPASWKPQVREQWGTLPPEIQAEVHRREGEVNKALKDSAASRQALEHVQRVMAPYAHNIRASGSDALGAINNFLQADNVLRHGSVNERAQMAANIIKQYGVDLWALDSILAGQTPKQDPNAALVQQLRREMNQQLQPVLGLFNAAQQRQQQAYGEMQRSAVAEVESFGQDASHEFMEDLREDMADILDMATKRGQLMTLQEAYDRAGRLHPQVSEVLNKRAESQHAQNGARAASIARRTAASIASGPAPVGNAHAGDNLRSAVAAAWEQHSGG